MGCAELASGSGRNVTGKSYGWFSAQQPAPPVCVRRTRPHATRVAKESKSNNARRAGINDARQTAFRFGGAPRWPKKTNFWRAITRPAFDCCLSVSCDAIALAAFSAPAWLRRIVDGPGTTQKVRLGRSPFGPSQELPTVRAQKKPVDGLCIDGLPVRFVQKGVAGVQYATASGWLVTVKRPLRTRSRTARPSAQM